MCVCSLIQKQLLLWFHHSLQIRVTWDWQTTSSPNEVLSLGDFSRRNNHNGSSVESLREGDIISTTRGIRVEPSLLYACLSLNFWTLWYWLYTYNCNQFLHNRHYYNGTHFLFFSFRVLFVFGWVSTYTFLFISLIMFGFLSIWYRPTSLNSDWKQANPCCWRQTKFSALTAYKQGYEKF